MSFNTPLLSQPSNLSPSTESVGAEAGVVVLNNKRYIPENLTHRKRQRTSWVGDYGRFLVEADAGADGRATIPFWICAKCEDTDKLFRADSTSSIMILTAGCSRPPLHKTNNLVNEKMRSTSARVSFGRFRIPGPGG
jgi:hypothetical protein